MVGTRGAFTKLRILAGVLSILLALETGYIIWGHHRSNRFKTMDEDGYWAFDSATGQLCRTFRRGARVQETQPAQIKPSPSSLDSKKSSPKVDPILSAIRGGLTEAEFEKMVQEEKDANAEAQAEFIRSLPVCADIH